MEKQLKDTQLLQLLDNQLENKFASDTCKQINKDLLGISNLLIQMPSSSIGNLQDEIVKQLVLILNSTTVQRQLEQFIYKVDLGETVFHQSIQGDDLNSLANAILIREAQKVYLRNKFSTATNS